MKVVPHFNAIVVTMIVYLFAIGKPFASNRCGDFYSSQNETNIEMRLDQFFVNTNHFLNLLQRANKLQIDPKNPEYQAMVSYIRKTIIDRARALEGILNTTEIITITSAASPGDLVIKFHKSKSYFLINLNKLSRYKVYDYKWDRDTVEEERSQYQDVTVLLQSLRSQFEQQTKEPAIKAICKSLYCRFFHKRRKQVRGPPEGYDQLSATDKVLVEKLYQFQLDSINEKPLWSRISDAGRERYEASWYRHGLATYLFARGIPKERWGNYRVGGLRNIEVNLTAEPFQFAPWGSLKREVTERSMEYLNFFKKSDLNQDPRQIFSEFLGLDIFSITLENLYLVSSPIRASRFDQIRNLIEVIYGVNHPLKAKMLELEKTLESEHQQAFIERKKTLLNLAKGKLPDVTEGDYFILDGHRIPFLEFSQLPAELQDYLKLEIASDRLTFGIESFGSERMDGLQSVYRAPFRSENEAYEYRKYFDVSVDTNFEPIPGFQVNHFRGKEGYSGRIFELQNIPRYLLKNSEVNSLVHPEVRFRYPVRIQQIKYFK